MWTLEEPPVSVMGPRNSKPNIFRCLIQLGLTISYAGPFAAASLAGGVII
jgi:hypothetical protein